jgi:hypothetical protein
MIRLLGARKFIDLPAGTLYVEHWCKNMAQCEEIIEKFKINPKEFFDTKYLMIYQNNSYSSLLENCIDEDGDIILTDVNVVGDACPDLTLRIVFDLNDLPENVEIYNSSKQDVVFWEKKEILNIINEIRNDPILPNPKWVYETLESLHKNGNKIVDVDMRAK